MSEHRTLRDAVWARMWTGGLSSAELLVALRLVEHWPRMFPGEQTLMRWTGLSESTVRRALRSLEDARVIRTVPHPGRSNEYQFLDSLGAPIRVPSLGPTPVMVTAPPVMVTGPTPVMVTAEADPDPKQRIEADKGKAVARKALPRKVPMPEDFAPNAGCLTLAKELGVSLSHELPQFIDHHAKNASRFADWQAALRTWIRNAQRFGTARGAPATQHNRTQSFLARELELAREQERQS